jgi:two-component sensor histidine kinase
MKRIFTIAMFLLAAGNVNGQIAILAQPTRQEINEFLKSLTGKMEDTARIKVLLTLAEYNLEKGNYQKEDLDSAAAFLRTAREINSRQTPPKWEGQILFNEATLARKNDNIDTAKYLANMAVRQLETIRDDVHIVGAYIELVLGYYIADPGDSTAIRNVLTSLFLYIQKKMDPAERAYCMQQLIHCYHMKISGCNYSVKLYYLDHLIRTYKMLNDKLGEFWARKEIADIHYKQGKLNGAIEELLQLAKEQKAGNYPRTCFTYDLLSGLYTQMGNYESALFYSLETIKNLKDVYDSTYLSNFYLRIAANYNRTGDIAKALEWSLKRLDYLITVKNSSAIYALLTDITSYMIRLGKRKEALDLILSKSKAIPTVSNAEKRSQLLTFVICYEAVNDRTMADKYCNELIKLTELRIRQNEMAADVMLDRFLASYYLRAGQYDKAESYFKKVAVTWPVTLNSTDALYKSNFLFKLDSAKGNYLSAIKNLQAAHMINDSLFTAAKSKQIEELKITYETSEKDQRIILNEQNIQLLKKEDQLQKTKLQQGTILRNISFAVVTLLIIIMALLYNRYRLKQRTNRKLELQQSEIAKQNNSLHHLVNEKEWLLKEIHHRVKNNLQVVMSLLNLQSAYIDNDAALTAIHDSQHRVHAMSLIHQKLYNSENVSSIDMSFYTRELVSYLSDSFDTGQRIRFELNIEPLEMDVSQAVPLGLILNEAITNSIKYAFPDDREGVISVSLSNTAPHRYLLSISDNGSGMPAQSDNKKAGSLGMSLMAGLSEDLDGNFSIENNNGTLIKISFVHDVNIKRPDTLVGSFVTNN